MTTNKNTDLETRTFAFIVDGEVIGTITIPSTSTNSSRLWAGLSSNPITVESTSTPGVQFGWKWDGTSFTKE